MPCTLQLVVHPFSIDIGTHLGGAEVRWVSEHQPADGRAMDKHCAARIFQKSASKREVALRVRELYRGLPEGR